MVFKIFKKVIKIALSFTMILIIIAILLNYIPVKFAVKLDDAKKSLKFGSYICESSAVTPHVGWYADKEKNQHLKEDGLGVRVSGSSPEKFLSEKTFDFKWYELYNQYLLVGDVGNF